MRPIRAGQVWQGKGARKGRRVALERTAGGPVGNLIRVHPEQLRAAYELVE